MNIADRKLLFWDFDGVIKDSVEAKTHAFVQLFLPFGAALAERVREHHENNGGMSRFEKIPLYLRWAGQEPTEDMVRHYCGRFGAVVKQQVIDSQWVPGAPEYIRANPHGQKFVLVSSTPQDEMREILAAIGLDECFCDVFGAPTGKLAAIRSTLERYQVAPEHCLVIGDALADWDAARESGVDFLLRQHATNSGPFSEYRGAAISDFSELLICSTDAREPGGAAP